MYVDDALRFEYGKGEKNRIRKKIMKKIVIEIVAANTPCFSYGDTAVFCF